MLVVLIIRFTIKVFARIYIFNEDKGLFSEDARFSGDEFANKKAPLQVCFFAVQTALFGNIGILANYEQSIIFKFNKNVKVEIFATQSTINPLSANPTKWLNTFKQFVEVISLSVFDHFVEFPL